MKLAPVQYAAGFTAAAATAARVPLPRLVDGDRVRALNLLVRWTAGAAVAVDSITLGIFAHKEQPATAAIAANGRVLLDTVTVPLCPMILDPLVAATGVGWVQLRIPLLVVADFQTRHVVPVVTGGAQAVTGFASLEVDRPADPDQK